MFWNISNHPVAKWSAEQTAEAQKYGEIRDLPFPNVPTANSTADVGSLAETVCQGVADSDTCMVQGEFTLVYAIVKRLRARGVRVVAACSERRVRDELKPDGSTEKVAIFIFVAFRPYE